MNYNEWFLLIMQPFLQGLVTFLGKLILAIIVFVIGYLISVGIGKVITEVLKSLKFNKLFEKEGWNSALQKANVQTNPAEFIGAIFKWVFVIMFLLIAVGILNLAQFGLVINQVLNYLPNVVVAALIFVVAVVIADIVEKMVRVAVERMKISHGYLATSIVKWALWIFVVFLILEQLLPNSDLVRTLYQSIVFGIVGTLTLGIGLAIGLGGKDVAADVIAKVKRKIEQH